jgi:hypothetical protein
MDEEEYEEIALPEMEAGSSGALEQARIVKFLYKVSFCVFADTLFSPILIVR